MLRRLLTLCFFVIFSNHLIAQEEPHDSTLVLTEVQVRAFEQYRLPGSTTANVRVLQFNNADRNNKTSLVNSMNTIAGVRMEERSPGSYRLNIRGSSLRSPFGVRNVKVYWNDIPITDPSGNTYFNQFAYNNFSTIEIFKGPSSSLYGAGTGGLILINNFDNWQPGVSAEYVTGSYNLHNVLASVRFGANENKNQLTYAHNQSDGYRIQTQSRKDNFSWQSQLKVSDKQQLTASVLYTDMEYGTPGALTLAEFNANPKAARPAGGGFPSAVDAKAKIFQKNLTVGISNSYSFCPGFKNNTTLYGTFNEIKNSAIRNYERRTEPQFGGRSSFIFNKTINETQFQFVAGAEFQQGYFNTQVSKNKNGNPDTLQTNDDVTTTNLLGFAQADINISDKWIFTAGLSVNKTELEIKRLSRYPVTTQKSSYKNELAPRFSVLKKFGSDFSLLGTVSKGFSPPTVAEVLPSTGVITSDLEAEHGINYEATARKTFFQKKLQLELTGFYFKLENALVQRRDLSGADYFVNAGDTKQKGLEVHAQYTLFSKSSQIIDNLILNADYTYSHFRYGSFVKGADDFSGKKVPSVPQNSIAALADIQFRKGFYLDITWYTAAKIYLNDANTAVADSYKLLGSRVGWRKTFKSTYRINLYVGADNLLDETYSLGNDINAAANRFYNAAPRRNYYVGVSFNSKLKSKN